MYLILKLYAEPLGKKCMELKYKIYSWFVFVLLGVLFENTNVHMVYIHSCFQWTKNEQLILKALLKYFHFMQWIQQGSIKNKIILLFISYY